ncbi:tyrosine--tRNA ligase [Cryptosporangium minutisporangium]|uniref:Tyrosine--tRNA ligase n=1 Tax=Cryptosporangium minutisporangium TaxID=113569 RepID=A0ABP6SRI6_9ACTN
MLCVSDFLDELRWRGLIAQTTDEQALSTALDNAPLTVYAGFDPTAASLHAGHLVPLLTLRRFQQAGHRPIVLAGGATGLIGDPSGRSSERVLNTPERVRELVEALRPQLAKFVDFEDSTTADGRVTHAAVLANNLDWTASISALDFLRDVGKHFPVTQMLARESVAARISSGGLSYTEFSYQLLQANDFLQLYRDQGCRLQIGGNDQWGNITAGLDYIRRVTANEGGQAHALTLPLLTNANGEKFGKSTGGGSVWLDPNLTSPYAWFQFWFNTDDRDVVGRLKTFTFLDRKEIEELETQVAERPAARLAQRRLAEEMTTLVHGAEETSAVLAASQALFGRGELRELPAETLRAALTEAGLHQVSGELPSAAALLQTAGLAGSLSEARRTVREGGAYVNNVKVTDAEAPPAREDLLHGRWLVLRRGKRTVSGIEVL